MGRPLGPPPSSSWVGRLASRRRGGWPVSGRPRGPWLVDLPAARPPVRPPLARSPGAGVRMRMRVRVIIGIGIGVGMRIGMGIGIGIGIG
jgi:hypothetical protein